MGNMVKSSKSLGVLATEIEERNEGRIQKRGARIENDFSEKSIRRNVAGNGNSHVF
jgi:hypothetical protein